MLIAWYGMWIYVRSKDAQKQLARTSLIKTVEIVCKNWEVAYFYRDFWC